MNPLFLCKDLLCRACERKIVPILLFLALLTSTMCGIIFIRTPAFYEFHLRQCDRFLDRVCYSDRNVFVIFLERTAGLLLLVALVLAGGAHPALLPLPAAVLLYRGYTFGGTLAVFFSVYGFSGAMVVFALYLPIHLLADALLLIGASLSCLRAFSQRGAPLRELGCDFLLLAALAALLCLIEMVLLLALFHPMGNLL